MALIEGCKYEIEVTVPVEEIQQETERIVSDIQRRAVLPGFRPGKAPAGLIRKKFESDIRKDVLEHVLPKAFRAKVEEEHLHVVGTPDVTDVHFHDGEPLRFKAEFEVAPEIELKEYKDLPVEYQEPEITPEAVDERIESIRNQKAEFVNEDPRPLADGDYAVVSLKSIAGVEGEPIDNDDMMLHIGDPETMPEFTEVLRGLSPGDERELDVTYPEDYAQERIAGKTVRFHVTVKGVRRRELPELNDEFARDLGDYQNMDELKEAVRKSLLAENQYSAQQEAKTKLVDALVEAHDFPVPEVFVDRQIQSLVESQLRNLASRGVDPSQLKLDWEQIKKSQRERAIKDVRGSLLLEKIADAENIQTTNDEVDRELQRFAKSQREPVAAVRMKFEKDGTLDRLAARIRTEKVLNFLFEHSRKIPKTAD
jgi:trigger factor